MAYRFVDDVPNNALKPGTQNAKTQGCICAIPTAAEEHGGEWWVEKLCPVHGKYAKGK